eukprot:g36442.t1
MAQSQSPQPDSVVVLGLDGSPGTALASTMDPMRRLPGSPTVQQIRRAIPAQLCRPSLLQSISYVARDLLQVAAAAWTAMGTNFWALFVLGHDCGHGSFASSEWLNDCVGWLLHTPLLVPYYPWKLTHRHHHRHTGHLHEDEVFRPVAWEARSELYRIAARPLLLGAGGLVWWLYLLFGYPGGGCYSHLLHQPTFCARYGARTLYQRAWVGVSRAGVLVWLAGLFLYWEAVAVACYYLVPVWICGSWLVAVTLLHHLDESCEYTSDSWTFLGGALNTVDRDYWPFQAWTHHIGTRQVHHVLADIPHYHLPEATRAFRAKFPALVNQRAGLPLWGYAHHVRLLCTNFYVMPNIKRLRWR